MITWDLKGLMEREKIAAGVLAKRIEVTDRTMSRMRGRTMPSLDQKKMADLLLALNTLKRSETPLITPNDLLIFSLTATELQQVEAAKKGG